jgi:peptidoglycan-N-acetylglucosamine deacetylase
LRPPYGRRSLSLKLYLGLTGRLSVLWDLSPDYTVGRDSSTIVNEVLQNTRPGSIILLHIMWPGREESRRALPAVISGLKARGFRFVTVSTLLESQRQSISIP